MGLADDLKRAVRGDVDDSDAARELTSRDASVYRVVPEVVVRPRDEKDIQALVTFVSDKKRKGEEISLTPRSAGTDMSGGPLTTSIVVDMLKYFSGVKKVVDGHAEVLPGTYFRDFDTATKLSGQELPSYTASREICTVGGMVGNNAGGEKNLKYGKTARYVESLDVVMADGMVHTLKNLEGAALTAKLREHGFEGGVYRACSSILQNNKIVIEKAKPTVEKNSSGYALWDIGDGITKLNLARLMVGAQGTLGIITNIQFALTKPEPYSSMLVVFVKDINDLGPFIPEVLKFKPDSFESYDDHTFSLAVKYFPEFAAQMKTNIISLVLSFLPEMWMVLTGGVPKLVLMIEFRGESQAAVLQKVRELYDHLDPLSMTERMHIVKNERAARKYWTIRHEAFNLLRKKVRGRRTAPIIDDFVVPPPSLPEFLPKLTAILDSYRFPYAVTGHVGDGNFHIFPLLDFKDPRIASLMRELVEKVHSLVLSYKGSISGEHNDGLIRTPYVEAQFGHEMYALFTQIKKIFDPLNIFNPGKKVGLTLDQAAAHLDTSK
ncbi:MAG: FAD-linked oxidase C-terminal domain-containing protein [Patescibacteria group bacterium]